MAIGLVVNRETQSLLVGESASADVVASIRQALGVTPGVMAVADLRTIHLGPDDLVVAAGILVDPASDAGALAGSIVDAKARVRAAVPYRTVIYLEPLVEARPAGPPP
jgi:divalent metal cation (Fe/Co/Zn/Cd) transporter